MPRAQRWTSPPNGSRAKKKKNIADQGQISKLLTRLQNLGLIHNGGQGQPKGAPNAWALTPKGAEVERSIRTDTGSRQAAE